MASKPTPTEAAGLLVTADALREQVRASAARESWAFFVWGVFALVMLPPLDVVDPNLWGPILWVVAFGAWLVTIRYFWRKRRVRLGGSGRWALAWIPWGVWYAGLVVMAEMLHPRVGFIWTVAGIAAALPLFIIGLIRRRAGR